MSLSMYYKNEYIKVFPIGFDRPKMDPGARALSERNLRFLTKAAYAKSSFVITDVFNNEQDFEFMIEGYYIKVVGTPENPISFFDTKKDVYATIFIDETNPDSPQLSGAECLELSTLETGESVYSTNMFTGVTFSEDKDVESNFNTFGKYTLKILTWSNLTNSYVIPEDSRRSTFIVDGGEYQ